mmetsp:Transcript_28370/g.61051  ORF Transcript_28370/g.61051 Transcript_28370/m.61051 type:complete len:93 (+) Transcript_28370:172-450(+)
MIHPPKTEAKNKNPISQPNMRKIKEILHGQVHLFCTPFLDSVASAIAIVVVPIADVIVVSSCDITDIDVAVTVSPLLLLSELVVAEFRCIFL